MSDHRNALYEIIKICFESSEYSRRTQAIHEKAMVALGFTESQRIERHTKAMMWAEEFKENRKWSAGDARRTHKERVEEYTGEPRTAYKKHILKG
jgi:hypothetical protein